MPTHRWPTIAHGLRRATVSAVERSDDRLGHRRQRLGAADHAPSNASTDRLTAAARVARPGAGALEPELRHLDAVAARVRLLDPVHTMARGWSITRTADGAVVRTRRRSRCRRRRSPPRSPQGSARSRVEETST